MRPRKGSIEIHTCSDLVGEGTITFDSLGVDFVITISEPRHDVGLDETVRPIPYSFPLAAVVVRNLKHVDVHRLDSYRRQRSLS